MSTEVIFLGGLGEIGRNMIAVGSGGSIVVVDAGLSFPTEEMLGVDLVLPDFSYLRDNASKVEAIVLTHGHEDHVGALAWLLQEIHVPVYGTPLTLGIARRRIDEYDVEPDLRPIGDGIDVGAMSLRPVAVSHSIPDAVGYAIDTPDGRIVYTGDFKIDEAPIDGRRTDMETFERLGHEGIDLLLSDSTNIETPGHTPSESLVGDALRSIFDEARGRIVVACFASNLHRMQQVIEATERAGRKLALVGRSMVANAEVGRELGHLNIPDGMLIDVEQLDNHPRGSAVVLCTGSQGEPLSALALIAAGEHRFVEVRRGDTVVVSASPIPGNESAVHRIVNAFYKAGAVVHAPPASSVHVSGHAAYEELAAMLKATTPRNFTPVHGEYRHLALHAELAKRLGIEDTWLVEDGDRLLLQDGRIRRGDRVPAGMVLVDGLGVGDVGPVVLRDRRVLAGDGIVICVVTIDGHTGEVLAGPDLITRGFVYEEASRDFLDDAADRVADALDEIEPGKATEWAVVKKACRRALGEYVWEQTRRRPMILPIVMEV